MAQIFDLDRTPIHTLYSYPLYNAHLFVIKFYCVVPENIYTHPKEFRGGGGSQKSNFLKESMKLNWNFQRVQYIAQNA